MKERIFHSCYAWGCDFSNLALALMTRTSLSSSW
jgi:hypothetical protein